MSRIARSEGLTESERYLAKLADRSFLNLWSFPNVYIDRFGDPKKPLAKNYATCSSYVATTY